MLIKNYPPHDMNIVFDMFEETLKNNGCADNAPDEMSFLNKLFGNLPAEAVEYGMRYLHGDTNLPKSCEELLPLYMRFYNFADYCEKLEMLANVPENLTTEEILNRSKAIEMLDSYEKAFLLPILGFKYDASSSAVQNEAPAESEKAEGDNALHLMNASATVFVSKDPLVTSLFYEQKCGFKAAHLEDEAMAHIRLTRDNIVIVIVKGDLETPISKLAGIKYDMYIYATEPLLLQNELQSNEVTIIEELPEAEASVNSSVNRQFVFEDVDGRHICVSQSLEIV